MSKQVTWSEVKEHAKDPWLVIDGKVYNCSEWKDLHPGGSYSITNSGGRDVSEGFKRSHAKQQYDMLADYYVGDLDPTQEATAVAAPVKPKKQPLDAERFKPVWMKAKCVEEAELGCARIELQLRSELHVPIGGHIELLYQETADKSYIKPYSPFATTSDSATIIVKPYKNGKVSVHAAGRKHTDPLFVRGPFAPRLPESFKPETFEVMYLIAGGTGIAPIYSVARCGLEHKHKVILKFFNTTGAMLLDELNTLVDTYGAAFDFEFISTKGDRSKYFNADAHLAPYKSSGLPLLDGVRYIACGSEPFNKNCESVLAAFKVPSDNVYIMA